MELTIFAILVVVGFFAGRAAEASHFRSIEQREHELLNLPAVPAKSMHNDADVTEVGLVVGECAISDDYFKMIVASLKSIVGGRLTTYESLLDRARREAILRMKEDAKRRGANFIANVRMETANINNEKVNGGKRGVTSVSAIVYGTALTLKNSPLG